jgi:hypothetical protein
MDAIAQTTPMSRVVPDRVMRTRMRPASMIPASRKIRKYFMAFSCCSEVASASTSGSVARSAACSGVISSVSVSSGSDGGSVGSGSGRLSDGVSEGSGTVSVVGGMVISGLVVGGTVGGMVDVVVLVVCGGGAGKVVVVDGSEVGGTMLVDVVDGRVGGHVVTSLVVVVPGLQPNILAHVAGPTTPSDFKPCLACHKRTTASVLRPKSPSITGSPTTA